MCALYCSFVLSCSEDHISDSVLSESMTRGLSRWVFVCIIVPVATVGLEQLPEITSLADLSLPSGSG